MSANGKRITRRLRAPDNDYGRRKAEAELALMFRQYEAGAGELTVSELLDIYLENRSRAWSPGGTRLRNIAVVRRLQGHLLVRSLTVHSIEETHRAWLKEGFAPATVVLRHGVLRGALNEAVRLGILDQSPAALVRLPKSPKTVIPDLDIAEVAAAIDRIDHHQMRVACRVGLATGARSGEVIGLKWSDIDFDGQSVRFQRSTVIAPDNSLRYPGLKTGKPKHLALDRQTIYDLWAWKRSDERRKILDGKQHVPWVFLSTQRTGMGASPAAILRWWKKHASPVGLDAMTFHDLRHLQATYLLGSGFSLPAVADRLGHSDPQTTLRVYAHAMAHHDRLIADHIGAATSRIRPGGDGRALAAIIASNATRISGQPVDIDGFTTLADLEVLAGRLGSDVAALLASHSSASVRSTPAGTSTAVSAT